MEQELLFGRWLKRLRAQRDLTQELLAERAGCASQTIRMIEGGHRRPSRQLAERLADVLQVSVEERTAFLQRARTKQQPLSDQAVESASTPSASPSLAFHAQLPIPPTPLIGRVHALAEVAARLRDPDSRLVTIVGSGGAGKTRLAVQVATNLVQTFEDGVAYVSLAPVLSGEGFALAVAQALGHGLTTGAALEDDIVQFLSDREMLLVLDNLEHLLDTADFIARIIEQAPEVRILATSRERLRIQAEWVIQLGGLALPQQATDVAIAQSAAVRLFVERAQRVNREFGLTAANKLVITQICQRLDGMPLALELAAAQVSFLPPAVLLQRLDKALPLLVDGARDLPPRQRTMRAAIEWSYNLLPENERALFMRLAVFMGGFTLEAAEVVGAGKHLHKDEILPLLRRLVDKSLVVHETAEGHVSYRLLEPIRQFTAERLQGHERAKEVHERHADFFLALAEEAETKLQSAEQVVWLTALEREHANLQVAMQWFLAQRDLERATRLCWALWLFLWMRGLLGEGRQWVERILPQTGEASLAVRGRALLAALVIGFGQGEYAWAVQFIDECFSIYHQLDDAQNLAHATSLAALNTVGLQQFDAAEPLMELGVQRYLALDSTWNAAMLLSYWAAIPRIQGNFAHAQSLTEQALALARRHGDRVTMYSSLFNLALLAQLQAMYGRAIQQFREALTLAVEIGDRGNMVACLEGIAGVAAALGDVAYAVQLWGAAEALLESSEAAIYSYVPDRTEYTQTIEKARRLLPAERWTALWNQGRGLGIDETLQMALHLDPERLIPEKPEAAERIHIAETNEVLTPREVEILQLIAQGQRNRVIAEQLIISEKTVQNHVSNIFSKLGVEDRSQAIVWAIQHDLMIKDD